MVQAGGGAKISTESGGADGELEREYWLVAVLVSRQRC